MPATHNLSCLLYFLHNQGKDLSPAFVVTIKTDKKCIMMIDKNVAVVLDHKVYIHFSSHITRFVVKSILEISCIKKNAD